MDEFEVTKIAVTGASGFIGKKLVDSLISEEKYTLHCLSRRVKVNPDNEAENIRKKIVWKKCDLFSMLDIEKAVDGCEVAIYLVHSMLPGAHLTQASFDDLDLILADNFARACAKKKVKQIIYLSGIIPESENLSDHLRSRLEVERTLGSYGIPLTTLRAGLILGPGGSSSSMVINLVRNLPAMILPHWTETLSNPISIDDAVVAIKTCVGDKNHLSKTYDMGGPEVVSYRDLIYRVASLMGKRRLFFSVPFLSQKLSKAWVSLITGAPKSLVTPLIYSLKHHMVVTKENSFPFKHDLKKVDTILLECIRHHADYTPHAYKYTGGDENFKEVRSVQRLDTVVRSPAHKVASLYMKWIPSLLSPFIIVKQKNYTINFVLGLFKVNLLTLEFSPERSSSDRQLFYIRGGLLAYGEGRGRLEFREVLSSRYCLAGIHEFHPRLPWYIYKYTQALIHIWVMKRFNKHLLREKY